MKKGLFLLTGLLFCSVLIFAQKPAETESEWQKEYNLRIKKSVINGVYIPKDLNDALNELEKLVDSESKVKFKWQDEEKVVKNLYFSFGRWIQYNWSLYEGSRLSVYFQQIGVTYPDDIAQLIITAFHRKLNKIEIDFPGLAKHFAEKRKEDHLKKIRNAKVIGEFKKPKDN
ncbi:MAG: hypothetical protein MK226_20365 [Saprospiraceae bacterium]|jgi:hypothetical protein|nr:hypothetical protein [Saprospiraceae bacterium]